MRRLISLLAFSIVAVIFATGCATPIPAGGFYTEVAFPGGVGSGDLSYSKVGVATSTSYLALIATGDASIKAAAENGGIKEIKYVDYSTKNVFGIIGEYTTTVYGN